MANHQGNSFFFLVVFSCFACSCYGHQLIVGGRDGWVLHPSESYTHWSGRLRFQVNDTLVFKYKQRSDSVLVVKKDDYDSCNINNPINSQTDGNSVFRLDRSGPFYFISGNKTSCDNGQKLLLVVLAIRNRTVTPPTAPSPGPQAGAPAPTGSSPSPSPAAKGPGSPVASSPGTGAPETANTPADVTPPQRSFAAAALSPSALFVSAVSFGLSVGLGGVMRFL